MDCEGNRDGPHCEICKKDHYFSHTPGTTAFRAQIGINNHFSEIKFSYRIGCQLTLNTQLKF